jgi:hypothetical protein
MTSRSIRRGTVSVAAALAASACFAGAAGANGPCGQNFDGNHACGVSSPASITGSLVTDNESDFYVFWAARGTQLSVSITDTENPRCTESYSIDCGNASVSLYNSDGDDTYEGASSSPQNSITVPGTFGHTLEYTGTYYLVVSGGLGSDANDNPTATPYKLDVNASPAVQWPPPPPSTTTTTTTTTTTPPPYKVCKKKTVRRHHRRVRIRKCHWVYP